MNQQRTLLFGVLVALILFCSLCLFTVSPNEHVIVEMFGKQVEPVQLFGEPPGWVIRNPGRVPDLSPGMVLSDAEYSGLAKELRGSDGSLPFEAERQPTTGTGLFLKLPAPLNRVHRFSNRINVFKEQLREIQTRSSEPVLVQPYLLWQIQDPLQFWKSVAGEERQIDEKLEARLASVMSSLIGSRYGVEDFYSLDVVKARALAESRARRLLAVVASDEMARKIEQDVNDFRDRRLLDMSLSRHKSLSAEAAKLKLPIETPEFAEFASRHHYHLNVWLSLRGGGSGPPPEAAVKPHRANYLQLLEAPKDRLVRERGLAPAGVETVLDLTRGFSAERQWRDVFRGYMDEVSRAVQEARIPAEEAEKGWADLWKSSRLQPAHQGYKDRAAGVEGFLKAEWGWSPERIAASRSAALLTFATVLKYRNKQKELQVLMGQQTAETSKQLAGVSAAERLDGRFVESLAGQLGARAPSELELAAETIWNLLVDNEVFFLRGQAQMADERRRQNSAGDLQSALRESGLVQVRRERENRIVSIFGAAAPKDEALADLRRRASEWAAHTDRVFRERDAEEARLQEIRGYPRATVEQLKQNIQQMERELSESSLRANNTVKIREMEELVRRQLNDEMGPQFGIVVREVGFRRLSFPPNVSVAVYQRMKSERNRISRTILAIGRLDSQTIIADGTKRKNNIIAEADAEAARIRGDAQAEAARIVAQGVEEKDVELFKLVSNLTMLEQMLNKPSTTLVIQSGKDDIFLPLYKRYGADLQVPAGDAGKKAAELRRGLEKLGAAAEKAKAAEDAGTAPAPKAE